MKTWRRQAVMFMCIGVALIGVMPFTNPGCQNVMVLDEVTGELRPATADEVKGIVEGVGDVAKVVTIAVGQPQYVPFIDIAVRLAALAVGFLYGRKELSVKTVTQAAASP